MLHIYSALVENERRLISERTKLVLADSSVRCSRASSDFNPHSSDEAAILSALRAILV